MKYRSLNTVKYAIAICLAVLLSSCGTLHITDEYEMMYLDAYGYYWYDVHGHIMHHDHHRPPAREPDRRHKEPAPQRENRRVERVERKQNVSRQQPKRNVQSRQNSRSSSRTSRRR